MSLTSRQRTILGLLAGDWTQDAIAARLGISALRVRKDIQATHRHYGVSSTPAAVAAWVEERHRRPKRAPQAETLELA